MLYGYAGKILWVDLTEGTLRDEPTPAELARDFIGGYGIAARMLYDRIPPDADPLGPENLLAILTGPLTGSEAPTGTRWTVACKSPLTDGWGDANGSGFFGPMMKAAGYDAVFFNGISARPVYLLLDEGTASLHPADDWWGMDTYATEDAAKDRYSKKAELVCIGPAGERLSLISGIVTAKGRVAARSGVGAVMGSKRLKAVVARGTGGVRVHDPARFAEAAQEGHALIAASQKPKSLHYYGTAAMMSRTGAFGALPTRNGQDTTFEHYEDISGEAMRRAPGGGGAPNVVATKACFACVIGCGRVSRIRPGHFTLQKGAQYALPQGGLEYESAYSLGAMTGVGDLDAATFANMVCNEEGMDPISFGVTLAAAMELFEKGVITTEQTGGIELRFGSAEALAEMALKTARMEGFGAELALGSRRLCEKYGHPELSISVKGQEFPGYDPRAMQGMGLAFATSSRGACHLRADPYQSDFETPDPSVKPRIVMESQNRNAAIDSLGLCMFTVSSWDMDYIARLLDAACPGGWTKERLLETGERIWTLERLFNLAAGLSAADDTLPPRMLKEPAPSGVNRGEVNHLDVMLPQYYELREWSRDGKPLKSLLKRLGLDGLSG